MIVLVIIIIWSYKFKKIHLLGLNIVIVHLLGLSILIIYLLLIILIIYIFNITFKYIYHTEVNKIQKFMNKFTHKFIDISILL